MSGPMPRPRPRRAPRGDRRARRLHRRRAPRQRAAARPPARERPPPRGSRPSGCARSGRGRGRCTPRSAWPAACSASACPPSGSASSRRRSSPTRSTSPAARTCCALLFPRRATQIVVSEPPAGARAGAPGHRRARRRARAPARSSAATAPSRAARRAPRGHWPRRSRCSRSLVALAGLRRRAPGRRRGRRLLGAVQLVPTVVLLSSAPPLLVDIALVGPPARRQRRRQRRRPPRSRSPTRCASPPPRALDVEVVLAGAGDGRSSACAPTCARPAPHGRPRTSPCSRSSAVRRRAPASSRTTGLLCPLRLHPRLLAPGRRARRAERGVSAACPRGRALAGARDQRARRHGRAPTPAARRHADRVRPRRRRTSTSRSRLVGRLDIDLTQSAVRVKQTGRRTDTGAGRRGATAPPPPQHRVCPARCAGSGARGSACAASSTNGSSAARVRQRVAAGRLLGRRAHEDPLDRHLEHLAGQRARDLGDLRAPRSGTWRGEQSSRIALGDPLDRGRRRARRPRAGRRTAACSPSSRSTTSASTISSSASTAR